jgi:hypothetical protein
MYYRLLYLGFQNLLFPFPPMRMGVRVLMVQDQKVWLYVIPTCQAGSCPAADLERNGNRSKELRGVKPAKRQVLSWGVAAGVFTNFSSMEDRPHGCVPVHGLQNHRQIGC